MKKGDVIKFLPNVRHWHGASPDLGVQQFSFKIMTLKGSNLSILGHGGTMGENPGKQAHIDAFQEPKRVKL